MDDLSARHRAAQLQFGKAAEAYVRSEAHAQGEELQLLLELAGDLREKRVLDVATGGGHTALAFARAGAKVVATDLTPEMLRAAASLAAQEEAHGIHFQAAAAEALPFDDASFEIVTCRIAAHHFAAPRRFLSEAARVLAPGGSLLLVDNVAPEAPALAQAMNRIEKWRDPSHVAAYGVSDWVGWCAEAGLEPMFLTRFWRRKAFEPWCQRAQLPAEGALELAAYVLGLPEETRRYLRLEQEGERLLALAHEVMVLAACKRA